MVTFFHAEYLFNISTHTYFSHFVWRHTATRNVGISPTLVPKTGENVLPSVVVLIILITNGIPLPALPDVPAECEKVRPWMK